MSDSIIDKDSWSLKEHYDPNLTLSMNSNKDNLRSEAIIIVDPISTGAMLAYQLYLKGFKIVAIFSRQYSEEILSTYLPSAVKKDTSFKYAETIFNDGLNNVVEKIKDITKELYNIRYLMVGSEPGVEFYDELTERIDYEYKNVFALSTARRNKYDMGEVIRNAGIRAVKQIYTDSWNEILDFIDSVRKDKIDSNNFKIVLKPVDSAGADGVYMASSIDEAKEAFDCLLGSSTIFETVNSKVLVQEYLKGTEYVIDSVSLRGEHRCTALWKYDKRRANNSQFVYYGVFLHDEALKPEFSNTHPSSSVESKTSIESNDNENMNASQNQKMEDILVQYTHQCLTALGIHNGPSHAEVMWLEDENCPCLVEVGARAHGGDATFMIPTQAAIGYNQITVLVEAVSNPKSILSLPKRPLPLLKYAVDASLVSYEEGIFDGLMEESERLLCSMKSFSSLEILVHKGDKLRKTIDLLTAPGAIQLIHDDPNILMKDYNTLHNLCINKTLYKIRDEEEGSMNLTESCHTLDMHSFQSPPKTPDGYSTTSDEDDYNSYNVNGNENNEKHVGMIEVSSELSLHTVVPEF